MNIKRITAATAHTAARAVELMVADMSEMWTNFQAGAITKSTWGAMVPVTFIDTDGEEAATNAYFYRAGDVVVCLPDFYEGEGYEMMGTDGNNYSVNEYGDLVAAE